MEKLGSTPRTPTLKVLAAQQDLAFCFVYVKCWGTNAMFPGSAASSASQFSISVSGSSKVVSSSGVLMPVDLYAGCSRSLVGVCGPLSSHISL
jgi:hypothetical protein